MARKQQKSKSATIEVALPKLDSEIAKGGFDDVWERLPVSIDKITDWFKQYQVETVELWISGVVGTGTFPQLIISAKGEGGMKVVLKPKAGK
jgi:hypothetical protein